MIKISKNFSLHECIYSDIASSEFIDNTITELQTMYNLAGVVNNILQPVRDYFCFPITITSGYRCDELNAYIGGARNSQHKKGEAIDFVSKNLDQVFFYIRENLVFDQLIWEKGDDTLPDWIHVSYSHKLNRNEVLKFNGEDYTLLIN